MWIVFPNTWKGDYVKHEIFNLMCQTTTKKKNVWYVYITWMSLWMWWLTISLEWILENTLRSSTVKASWALVRARPVLSQMLDDQKPTFSLPLSIILCLFGRGVISSTEVVGEVALVASRTEVTRVIGVPFSTTRTTFFPKLKRGSFFLALILAYISWLNLVIISTRKKDYKKKKN